MQTANEALNFINQVSVMNHMISDDNYGKIGKMFSLVLMKCSTDSYTLPFFFIRRGLDFECHGPGD